MRITTFSGISRWGEGPSFAFRYRLLVTLTKVRAQGYGRRPSWLWVLTFVRMTVVG
jgi:hypothetical protein